MNKIFLIIIVLLGFLSIYFYQETKRLKLKIDSCAYEKQNLSYALKEQNKAIEKLKLDSKQYEKTKNKTLSKVITHIESIPKNQVQDCESALNYISKILEE